MGKKEDRSKRGVVEQVNQIAGTNDCVENEILTEEILRTGY
jgi:hypothetical protein